MNPFYLIALILIVIALLGLFTVLAITTKVVLILFACALILFILGSGGLRFP